MPPKQQLSKGTLGLKFMNRVVPSSPASTPPPPPAQQAPAATAQPAKPTPTAATSTSSAPTTSKSAAPRTKAAPDSAPAPPARAHGDNDDNDWSRRTVGGARTVIHELSLLSFPLLSTLSTRASTSTSTSTFTSTNATYSSMPLTAGAISGRRSYGGANVEIERLNDPSSHEAPPATAESKTALKKRQKAERDAETVPVRRSTNGGSTLSSAKTGKRTATLEAERRGVRGAPAADEEVSADGTKRRRTGDLELPQWDGGEDEVALGGGGGGAGKGAFARPAGFEGARAKGKGKGRAAGDALLRDDGEAHRWGKGGETRAWDEDKAGDSSGSDVDVEGMSDFGGMSGEDDSDDSVVEEEVAPPVKKGKAQKKHEVERAFERSEEGRSAKAAGSKRRR